jgi:hypothetical protein
MASREFGVMSRVAWLALLGAFALAAPLATVRAQAPSADSSALFKGLDLETAGKNQEAAQAFRAALHTTSAVTALLGLERVDAALGWQDSLLVQVDSLIARDPHEPVYRSVKLRTLVTLGREGDLRRAFEQWARDVPDDPTPYREYARILLQRNEASAADSVIQRARQSLGSTRALQLEIAQLRAATGSWLESAQAWRRALEGSEYLEQAAVYSLAPMPDSMRAPVVQIFMTAPVEPNARRVVADLETNWGSPTQGWAALRDLPNDSASAAVWLDFAQRAESEERWTIARAALVAALGWKRTPELEVRAATAALNAGDAAAVPTLAPVPAARGDSALIGRTYVPLYARAYAMLGKPADAARLVSAYEKWIPDAARLQLTRTVAWGWVRAGDMTRAREALAAAGPEADSSDAAGWLALYDGNLRTARVLLRGGTESTSELALALGLIARLTADTAPMIGQAFLDLARADTAKAAAAFETAAARYPAGASLMLSTAARLQLAQRNTPAAMVLWQRIVEQQGATPEAPQAELEWARALRARGDNADAVARLEHLILTYPESALVPQARRELELARGALPGSTG